MKSTMSGKALPSHIEPPIWLIRGQKITLDADLAQIYGVSTKRLNEQVKRDQERFPDDFMFRLTVDEIAGLNRAESHYTKGDHSQIATSSQKHRDPRYLPYAFT